VELAGRDAQFVAQGDSVTLRVVAQPTDTTTKWLYGAGFRMYYASNALDFGYASRGPLADAPGTLDFLRQDSDSGWVAYSAVSTWGAGMGAEGDLCVMRFRVKPDAPLGFAYLTIVDATAIDSAGNSILAHAWWGYVIVRAPTSSIEDLPSGAEISLGRPIPNPSRESASFDLSLPRPERVSVAVFDLQGRCRLDVGHEAPFTAGRHRFAVPVNSLVPGVYLARFRIGDRTLTRRIVRLE
jgi:hypothetical protein